MIYILVALVLFIISVISDRVFSKDAVAQWSFGLATVSLWVPIIFSFTSFMPITDHPPDPTQMSYFEWIEWITSQVGWPRFLATIWLSAACASGVMLILSSLVNAVKSKYYALAFGIAFTGGIIFILGFYKFFEGFSLILGIVATAVGILVGIKKLRSYNSD